MMDSVRFFLRNFIKYFLYIAVFAQIVTGTVYLVCNFTEYIVYPETEEMVHVARGLLFDEYTGVLYPLFIRVCLLVQNMAGIGYYLMAHFVQLLLLGAASLYLVGAFYGGKKTWIVAAYILTFPMCMQTILMVSPFAFKASFSFLIIGAMLRIWRKKENVVAWVILFGAYILEAFNVSDDLYLWLIPIGIFVIAYVVKKRKSEKIWKLLCLVLIAVFVFAGSIGISNRVIDAGARGRMQRTVSSVLFQRTLWPKLNEKFDFLPIDMQSYIDLAVATESNVSSEKMIYVIGPRVDREAGFQKANELYMEAFLNQLAYNKRNIATAILEDFTGYLTTPYGTLKYLVGQEGSCFSSLYGAMNANNPKLVYLYFCIGFVSLFITTFGALLRMIKERLFVKNAYVRQAFFLGAVLVYQALWYSIGNVQGVDYRYSLLNIAIFSVFALSGELFRDGQDKESKKECKYKITLPDKQKYRGCTFFVVAVAVVLLGVMLLKKDYQTGDLLAGEKIVCFGDSIWGLVTDDTGVGTLVENMTGATVINYAVSGSTATDTTNTDKEDETSPFSLIQFVKKLEEGDSKGLLDTKVLEEAEYLIIAYGLNDYFYGLPIESKKELDEHTYAGALEYAVTYFKEHYPNLEIILIGQTYCQFYSYGIVENDSDTKDFGGGVGMDYVKAAGRIAEKYDVLFINQYENLPINEWNGKKYLEDSVHLTKRGRMEYAKVVSEYINDDYKERNAR